MLSLVNCEENEQEPCQHGNKAKKPIQKQQNKCFGIK